MKIKHLLLMLLLAMIAPWAAQAQQALPYSYGFEDNDLSADGWTTQNPSGLDASKFMISTFAKRTGDYGFQFSSYDDRGAHTQYLISPELNAPCGVVAQFYYRASNASGTEQFKVGYSTTDTDIASFTFGSEISTYHTSSWTQSEEYTFPAGTKYVAIYYYSDYQYYLYVDDFTFSVPRPTDLSVSDTTISTATVSWSGEADSYNVRYRTADGTVAYFYEDFEGLDDLGLPEGWTSIDADGDGNGWYGLTEKVEYAHSGECFVTSASWNGDPLTPDNWLVTPQIALQGTMKVYLRAQDPSFAEEHYAIYLSTTGNTVEDFTTTLVAESYDLSGEYLEITADLSSYNGQLGYIAIRHFNCTDMFRINVDDFGLYGEEIPAGEWMTATADETTITLTGLAPETTYEVQVQTVCGEDGESSWSDIITFTTLPAPAPEPETYALQIYNYHWYEDDGAGYYLIAYPFAGEKDPTEIMVGAYGSQPVASMVTGEYDLYFFDQSQVGQEWRNYKDTISNPNFKLENGKGYLYAYGDDVQLYFTGYPIEDTAVKIGLVYDTDLPQYALPGWNLVGNPFKAFGYPDRPGYRMWEDSNELEAFDEGEEIFVAEGVFIEAQGEGDTVTFTKGQGGWGPGSKKVRIRVNNTNGRGSDVAYIRFGEGRGLHKFQLNPNHTKLYIPVDGADYAIAYSAEMGETPLNFKAETNGTYTLSFTTEEISFNYLHLIDNMTGTDVDLLATPYYSFAAKTTDYASRFKLVYATGANSDDSFAFMSNGSFIISNEGEATLQVVDVTGRVLSSETISGSCSKTVNAAPGVYMLRLISGDNMKVQKVIVR